MPLLTALAFIPCGQAEEIDRWSVFATATTDYRFRGASQTEMDPALQIGINYDHDSGFFAGLWSSTVSFADGPFGPDPRDVEVNLYAGYGRRIGDDFTLTGSFVHYDYPGTSFDLDYDEVSVSLLHRSATSIELTFSDDSFNSGEALWSAELESRRPLQRGWEYSGALGFYVTDRLLGSGYGYGHVGVSKSFERFVWDLRYHAATSKARYIWKDGRADNGVALSVTLSIL